MTFSGARTLIEKGPGPGDLRGPLTKRQCDGASHPAQARSGILTGMLQEEVARESTPAGQAGPSMVSMPPGPPLPRLLQTLGFIFAPAPFLDACRRRYGDVVTMGTLFDPKFVMVFDPGSREAGFSWAARAVARRGGKCSR